MGVFRKRDVAMLLLVAVALYITIFDSPTLTYKIDAAWFVDQQPQKKDIIDPSGRLTVSDLYGGRGHFDYKQIPPLITDLDGDGRNEIIMISTDLQLQIFDANIPGGDSNEVYHPVEINAVDLYPELRSAQRGREPVALKSGYVERYSKDRARSQVIVVVHDDWTVSCYDYSLNMLWEKAAGFHTMHIDEMSRFFRIDDAAVYIAPLHLKDEALDAPANASASGTVIVGASMKLREQYQETLAKHFEEGDEERGQTSVKYSEGLDFQAHGRKFADYKSQLEHFTLYALDARHGEVIWTHNGQEVHAEQYSRSLPQHAYSLDLKDLMTKTHHAPGINDWTIFRQSLLDELPHTWFGNHHTNIRIAHFMRRHIGAHAGHHVHKAHRHRAEKLSLLRKILHPDTHKGKGRNGRTATQLRFLPLLKGEVHAKSLSESATLPHNAAEHTENPNVIVAHTRRGVEVIALRTGVPITSLALSPHRVHADVNGDDIVDTITVLDDPDSVKNHESEFRHHQFEFGSESLKHCMMVVMSGLPAQSQLFNGSVCQSKPSLRDKLGYASIPRQPTASSIDDEHIRTKMKPSLNDEDEHPMIVHAAPLILHKLDPDTLEESDERDIITAIHTGVVTSYSGNGDFNWQLKGGPTWSIDADAIQVRFPSMGPSGPPDEGDGKDEVSSEKASTDYSSTKDPHGRGGSVVPTLTVAAVVGFDADADRAEDLGIHNSIYSNILVIGESTLALLSREGEVLASAEIPRAPKAAPVLGDFDNDGVSDILIVTDGAVLGFHVHVEQASRGVLIALCLLIIITMVVFVSNVQSVPLESLIQGRQGSISTSASSSTAQRAAHLLHKPRGKSGSSIFQIIRSTDEQHLD